MFCWGGTFLRACESEPQKRGAPRRLCRSRHFLRDAHFSANAHFWRYVLLERGPSTGSRVLAPGAQRAVSVSPTQELSTGCPFFALALICDVMFCWSGTCVHVGNENFKHLYEATGSEMELIPVVEWCAFRYDTRDMSK